MQKIAAAFLAVYQWTARVWTLFLGGNIGFKVKISNVSPYRCTPAASPPVRSTNSL